MQQVSFSYFSQEFSLTFLYRYAWQCQSSSNIGYFQGLSLYYATVGFYLNHMLLYWSIWFTLVSQLILIIVEVYIYELPLSNFISSRVYSYIIALTLVAPGVFQMILEFGVIKHFGNI